MSFDVMYYSDIANRQHDAIALCQYRRTESFLRSGEAAVAEVANVTPRSRQAIVFLDGLGSVVVAPERNLDSLGDFFSFSPPGL